MEEVVLNQKIEELKAEKAALQANFDSMVVSFNRLLKVVEYWEGRNKIATDSLKHGERYQVIYDKQLYVAQVMAGEFVLTYTEFPPLRFDQVIVIKKLEAE